ncbi:Ger(x)C family spore germination protein [Paenibacillus chitinolyticus]|uniref:Ger(X)C family spore germination protein n=1 Tax=Paenibacillus chitinolyticus TaxID=79263 RepID=A0A410WWE4_9BACL|nr:Ger(x)C family spore germination protein [Paenibacillus chitinolyticus]MCY9593245.1 Ger(x)C family spore germination protein [Paenibacillus chitinolyticus]MCY9597697.1 Ger(x)C family spore germination protein [Paenibacillus chitinolyticus]QAV18684.1 Ger(x)C family spore germination protein [Paenibacillus chitinolyticus]
MSIVKRSAWLGILLLLTGCWNSKDLQTMAYATALGIDYADGKYITYVQILNFSNIAKSENNQVGTRIPIWVGRGEGKTVSESLTSIYSTSQLRLFWGHVKAVIVSEALMKKGLPDVYDMLNRYREIRYNILFYGTNKPLDKMLSLTSMLNFSPIESLLTRPEQYFSQKSLILPVYGYKFIANLNEAGNSTMLPSLTANSVVWEEDRSKVSLYEINGAYFFNGTKYTAWLSQEDLKGARWLQTKLERTPLSVPKEHPIVALILESPKYKVDAHVVNEKIRFTISMEIKAFIDEFRERATEAEIETAAETDIKNEILMSFHKGIKKRVDVLKLSETLYRKYPDVWKTHFKGKEFPLDKDSIEKIDVKVNISHTGKYKERK